MFGVMESSLKLSDGGGPHSRAGSSAVATAIRPRRSLYLAVGKPLIDRAVGLVLLAAAAPVLGLVAAAVALRLGRPVLLAQERVGRGGKVFRMYKFRTMLPDRRTGDRRSRAADAAAAAAAAAGVARREPANPSPAPVPPVAPVAPVSTPSGSLRARSARDRRETHKSERDPRHTPLGRMLRAASLDELPQLWNVVRGDMSLVGPRPELASVVERDGLADHPRHLVRPGITGPWQLSPARNVRLSKNLHYDEDYLRTMSLRVDAELLVRTLRVPFRKAGS